MRRALGASYEGIAAAMKREIGRELEITVSVGPSLTKVLAKIASRRRKPEGLTIIPGRTIVPYLQDLSVEKIWGIGLYQDQTLSTYRNARQREAGRTSHKGADPALRRKPPQTPGSANFPRLPRTGRQLRLRQRRQIRTKIDLLVI